MGSLQLKSAVLRRVGAAGAGAAGAVALGLATLGQPTALAAAATPIQAAWHGDVWSVPVLLKGKVKAGAAVTASAPCAIGTCTASAIASKKGKWAMRLDAIENPGTTSLSVQLASGTDQLTQVLTVAKPTTKKPGKNTVMVIGDSLAVGTRTLLPADLPGRPVTTQAVVGRFLAQGRAVFDHTPLDTNISVVVFSLFTNDDPSHVAILKTNVQQILDRLGPKRCAVWFTIRRPAVGGVSYKAANAALTAMASDPANGGRLIIVPWYDTVAGDHTLVGSDRVHPTPAGYKLRAQMTADAVKSCPVSES